VRFTETKLPGVYIIDVEPIGDSRGFFARTWAQDEFAAHGLDTEIAQCNLSGNARTGTLRGMHCQDSPHEENKLVRCSRGALYDVALDLRPDSPTFTQWVATELTAENRRAFYIPKGCAHGFQTLTDDTEVFYQISAYYAPAAARGVRWDDPAFGITWPLPVTVISERDANHPDFST
jgi:dTDP-4-dehydrorhamnose 3,5-epimerase